MNESKGWDPTRRRDRQRGRKISLQYDPFEEDRASDYSLGRGLVSAIRRMKDKWTSAKAFAKENNSTTFAEYRKMTRIERMLMKELNARDARQSGDTAYSAATAESDSDGNTLSYGQQKYFAKSKVRDANGRLLVVYHGTDADFDAFDLSKAGKNGRQEGFGFYFAANQEITKKYGEKQKKVYLNIEKPLYDNRRTVTKAELRKFANALVDYQVTENGEDWRDTFISNYVDTYGTNRACAISQFVETIWEFCENDQDLIYEIANGSGMNYDVDTMEPFYNVLYQSIGYDGNISTWKHENGTDTIYVTFRPEQAKYVSNFDPTESTDLRFSPASVGEERIAKQAERFEKRIKSWDRKTDGFSFLVCDTTSAIANIKKSDGTAIGKKQVRIDATKIKSTLNDHPKMDIDVLAKLPEVIAHPVLVLDSKSVDGRLVAFGEVYDNKGTPVMVALELKPTTRSGKSTYVDIIKIASAYGRTNTQNLINKSTIRYKDESRLSEWLNVNRLQLPLRSTTVEESASDDIISQQTEKSNPSGENISYSPAGDTSSAQFKRWFGNSVVKNEDGTPKVVYHGTGAEFTAFSKEKIGTSTGNIGIFGKGFYFTNSEKYADYYNRTDGIPSQKGVGKTLSVYLSMQNPFEWQSIKTEAQFKSFLSVYGLENAGLKWNRSLNEIHTMTNADVISSFTSVLQKAGFDGVIYEYSGSAAETAERRGYGDTIKEYVVFEPSQIKSADPVTYDDKGNIIPLSERFNPQNNDIRYSPAEPQRRVVTRAQMPRPGITERITNAKGQLNRHGFKNALDNASSACESFKIVTVNAQQALENQLIRGGMTKRQAAAWSQLARTGRLHANNAIGYALADMTGEVRSDGERDRS